MYVDDCKYNRDGKSYRRVLLRDNVKINGKHKLKTIANISNYPEEEIEAIKTALKYKKNIAYLEHLANGEVETGKTVGDVAALYQVANRLGINKALGNTENAKLILWLVISMLIDQGPMLSSVQLAESRAVLEIIGMRPFCEEDIHIAMDWLYENHSKIKKRHFDEINKSNKVSNIFLYVVSSFYLEEDNNDLEFYGHNRDKKKCKNQVVFVLLTDDKGGPVSIEALECNETLVDQILVLKERFKCKYVTIVGDKGMIKTKDSQKLEDPEGDGKVGWIRHITFLTKAEVHTLCSNGVIQSAYFDKDLYEIYDLDNNIRYILKCNPYRTEENPESNTDTREKAFRLDGCYGVKTNLPASAVSRKEVYDRYKELAHVQKAFRVSKNENFKERPVYACKKEKDCAHFFIQMLAYMIERYLRFAWNDMNITVLEGIQNLSEIKSVIISIGEKKIVKVPKANPYLKEILKRLKVSIPEILPYQ